MKKLMKFSVFTLPPIILSTVVIFACDSISPKQQPAPTPHTPLTVYVGGGYWPGFLPIALAQEKGFFIEEGASIEFLFVAEPSNRIEDFETGDYDGAAYPFAQFMDFKTRMPDIHVILVTDESTTADAVVARTEIKTIADLKGKRVMAVPGAYGDIFVLAMLEKANLTGNDISWLQLNQANEALDALKRGEVDAVYIWEPFVTQAVNNGAHVIFTGADVPGLVVDAVAFHEEAIRERPDDIQAFVRGWFRAVEYWQENPDESVSLVAKSLKLDPAQVSLEGLHLLSREENIAAFTPGDTYRSLYFLGESYNGLFLKKAILNTPIDMDAFLDPQFVKGAN